MIVKVIAAVYQGSRVAVVGPPAEPLWLIDHADPDGSGLHTYGMPPFKLISLAVEYGLDPADSELLLDIALHEMGNPVAMAVHHDHPQFVYNVHEQAAREALLQRHAVSKQQIRHDDPQGLLGRITAHHQANLNHPQRERYAAIVARGRRERIRLLIEQGSYADLSPAAR